MKSKHFRPFSSNLLVLSIEGAAAAAHSSSTSTPSNNLTVLLHSDGLETLGKLQYLSLENVELLDFASEEIKHPPGSNLSATIVVEDQDQAVEILPYKEFKELVTSQRQNNEIWDGFVRLTQLETLHIIRCRLPETFSSDTSASFASLTSLKELIVQSSKLKIRLGTSQNDLKSLKSLSLADNELLDVDLKGMNGLNSLDLSGNQLDVITNRTLPTLDRLETLDLSGNPIRILFSNAFIRVASSLRHLRIRRLNNSNKQVISGSNNIVELHPGCFNSLNQLKELNIEGGKLMIDDSNHLNTEFFKDLNSLTELRMTNGWILSIEADAFAGPRLLKTLILKKNRLRRLSEDSFQYLIQLRKLDLSGNELSQVAPALFQPLTSLKELWLNGNQLAIVPPDFFAPLLHTTKLIRLDGNPWDCSTCQLSQLRATSVNKIKVNEQDYQYDRRVTPLCSSPEAFRGIAVFDVMRKELKCGKKKTKKSLGLYNYWNEPSEPVDHGAEVVEGEKVDPSPVLNGTTRSIAEEEELDIIDHGEEVVEGDQVIMTSTATSVGKKKHENEASIVDNAVMVEADPSRMLKSGYFTLSKKSQKLRMEEAKKTNQVY